MLCYCYYHTPPWLRRPLTQREETLHQSQTSSQTIHLIQDLSPPRPSPEEERTKSKACEFPGSSYILLFYMVFSLRFIPQGWTRFTVGKFSTSSLTLGGSRPTDPQTGTATTRAWSLSQKYHLTATPEECLNISFLRKIHSDA